MWRYEFGSGNGDSGHCNGNYFLRSLFKSSFLLVIIALGLSTYKTVFTVQEVGNTEELEQRDKENEEKALEELEDIEIDDIEIEDLDLE